MAGEDKERSLDTTVAIIATKVDLMFENQKEFQSEMRSVVGEAFKTIRQVSELAVTKEELDDKLKVRDNMIGQTQNSITALANDFKSLRNRPSWLVIAVIGGGSTILGGIIASLVLGWMGTLQQLHSTLP